MNKWGKETRLSIKDFPLVSVGEMKEGDQYLLIMTNKAEWLEMRKNSSQETHAIRHYKGFIKSNDSKLILQVKILKLSLCQFLCFKCSHHNQ